MPDYKGRIFGPPVLDVRFRAFYGEDLFLGELLARTTPSGAGATCSGSPTWPTARSPRTPAGPSAPPAG